MVLLSWPGLRDSATLCLDIVGSLVFWLCGVLAARESQKVLLFLGYSAITCLECSRV
jgi:hypothetical protein